MSYEPKFYKYVWGYFSGDSLDKQIIQNMLGYLGEINLCNELPIRANMAYFDLMKGFFPGIFIDTIIERMVLCNERIESKKGIVLRSWIG